MRKIKQFLLATAVLIASTAVTMAAYNGTPKKPSAITESNYSSYHLTEDYIGYYAITSAAELYGFAEYAQKNMYIRGVLTTDIVVNEGDISNGYKWYPIGCKMNNNGSIGFRPFMGTFDGNGHTISGLNINQYSSEATPFLLTITRSNGSEVWSYSGSMNVGFFGCANGATIKNLGIINSRAYGYSRVGGICGYCYSSGDEGYWQPTIITNCFFEGAVNGTQHVGGICGIANANITNCYYKGSAHDGSNYTGGITGQYGTLTNCVYVYSSNISYNVVISGGNSAMTNCRRVQDDNAVSNGHLCYALNDNSSEGDLLWYQNLGGNNADPRPVMNNTHGIVYYSSPCKTYNNNSSTLEHNFGDDHICTRCGYVQGLEKVEDAAHAAELGLPARFVGWSIISTVDDLYQYAALIRSGTGVNAVLLNDITVNTNVLKANGDLNGDGSNFRAWTPIYCKDQYTYTEFDGNGHIISGLYYYSSSYSYIGLFGDAMRANISNVGVVDSYFQGKGKVGGIAGRLGTDNRTHYIKNCYFAGTVVGTEGCVGGICGEAYCYSSGSKVAKAYVQNCYNTGKVVGGVGSSNLYNGVGGISGRNGVIENCYNTGTISGTGYYVGGICGYWGGNPSDGSQTNNWYLTGCATDGNGKVQNGMGYQTKGYAASDNTSKTAPATTAQFASGEVAYKLNGSTSTGTLAWYQNIDANPDPLPVLDATHGVVWNATTNCARYANSEISDHLYNDDGVCTVCGDELTLTQIDGVYQIGHQKQLYLFAQLVNSGTTDVDAVLTADIVVNTNVLNSDGTLNGNGSNFKAWTPIGTMSNQYYGTFDGQGHTISGLYYNNTTNGIYPNGGSYVGLFGYAYATIKNVGLVDSYFNGYRYVGGICGYNGYCVYNCYNAGAVTGRCTTSDRTHVGGICGSGYYILSCYNTGNVYGRIATGGISGYGFVYHSYNCGKVYGWYEIGAICGYGDIGNCYYLAGSAKSSQQESVQYGKGYSSPGAPPYNNNDGCGRTADEFASGKVGYELNTNADENEFIVWRQNLMEDARPTLDIDKNLVMGYIRGSGNNYEVVGNMYLSSNYEVEAGKTLYIPSNGSLTTTGSAIITNNGTLVCDGTLEGNDLNGNGIFKYEQFNSDDIALTPSTYTYKGSAYEIGNGLTASVSPRIMCGKAFTFSGNEPTATGYENNTNAGTATVIFDYDVERTFTIKPLEVTLNWSEAELPYSGAAQAPSATVGNLLGNDVCEVTVDGAQTAVGGPYIATATALSNSNYALPENVTTEFSIVSRMVSEPTIVLSANTFTYNGQAQTPTVTVKDGNTTIDPSEYTVTMSGDVTNAGQKTVTISNVSGNYNVSGSATFTINPKEVTNPTIALSATSFTYNGSAIEPTVTVKNGETIIDPSEYTVSYSNNTNAGTTATVTITDKADGNYTVSGSATFTINPKVVSSPTIALSQTSYTYNGSAQTPTVTVKDGETTIPTSEYTVSYPTDVTNAGQKTINISNVNGNYTVSNCSATFTINPKEVTNPTIELSQTSYTYNGSAQTPTVTVKDGSTTIASGEYTVSYSNNTNAGTATVTIADKANGNYTVSGSATFTISPKEVSSPTIEFSDAEITYTGSALTPTITVKDGSTVIPTSEYTVSYSNNTNAGTANLTITDKANGNYTVSGETTFTINPKTVSNPTIILSQTTFIYDGTAKSPTVTSVKDGSTVIPASEYTVTMPDDAVSVGDYTVEIEDIDGGNYTVRGTATYVINLCTEHQFDNFGQCTVCGEYTQPELVDGVYQIASAANLYWFASWVNKGNAEASAVLTADIVVNSNVLAADGSLNGDGSNFRTWTPIGYVDEEGNEYCFSGTFDGNGHTVSGLYSVGYEYNVGLFGIATEATIKNVGIVDSYISGGAGIGGICGSARSNSTITNCYNTGAVSSEMHDAGGICGDLVGSEITNCYNTATVTCGESYAGGICGYAYNNCTITNCHNTGAVSSEMYDAGGICGAIEEGITITNCYNTGAVTCGESYAGGICGELAGSEITNCYNTGAVTCGEADAGGICGYIYESTLTNNFYLAGCATVGEGENVVVQNGVGVDEGEEPAADAEGQTTAATASEFASGRIAYLLNGSEFGGSVWHQTLFADEAPVLNAEHNSVTGYIAEEGGGVTVTGDVVVATDYEVANGKTLNIPAGASLTTRGDGAITNNGTIVLNGTLAGNDLAGEGNFIYGGQIATADLVLSNANYVYKGSAYDDIEFTVCRTICGKVFTYGDAYTVSYANNINAGQATISLTNNNDAENVVSSQFTINPIEDEVVVTVTLADKSVAFSGAAQTYNSEDALTIEANNALYNISWVSASGNAASVSGTNAAEYAFGWNAEMFSNTSTNFTNVRFDVTDGKLIITPNTEVVVTVTENSSTLTYNGEEQSVSGYSVAISDATGVYSEDDIAFSGTATASGINAGVYQMQLSAADFSNTNKNFADVTFNIVDGALTINRAADAPNKPEATMETRYINTQLVALPADWAWSGNKALEMGANTATANYTGADKGNYVTESVEVTITRTECPHNEGNELLYTLDATCTHKGYTGNTSCKLCGQIYQMGDSIPALGHDFVNTVVAPTCTAEGYTEHLCSRCQHIEYSDTVAATGHKADSVVFENVVAATCTEAGSRDSVVYCSVCQIELSRTKVVIPAGHHIVVDPAVAATCTATGLTEGSHCDVCHEVLVAQTTTTAAGHAAGAAVAENLKAATCTAAGSVDSVVYCTVCKAELSRKTVEIPVASHTAGAAVAENLKAATCTAAGSVDSVVYCTVCKAEISRKTVELPVIAHTEVVDVAVAATCTESGLTEGSHCSVCNTIIKAQEVIPAKGHKADSIVIENVVAATYKAAGSYDSVVYCSVCKVELSRTKVVVPQLVVPKIDTEVVISQIEYTVGDSLKLDGGKIIIATSDSTTAEVVITPEMVSGFNPDSVGVQTVTVAFEIDGVTYTTTFDVEVKDIAKPIDAEVVISQINYTVGDSLKLDGGKIVIATSDSTTAEVVITPEMVKGFNPDSVGVQTVTVSFEIDGVPYTTTFDVEVKEAEVIEVVAKSVALSAPAKVTYKKGEQLDIAGGKLIVTYSDGTTQDVDLKADMISGFDAEKVGTQKLTITLKIDKVTLTATFDVTVEADDNTAISDAEAAAVNIYAFGNTIVVENAENDIYVYDAMGRLIVETPHCDVSTEIRINRAGVYIVKTGTTAKRVMIND